jgi:hypothetical protein
MFVADKSRAHERYCLGAVYVTRTGSLLLARAKLLMHSIQFGYRYAMKLRLSAYIGLQHPCEIGRSV